MKKKKGKGGLVNFIGSASFCWRSCVETRLNLWSNSHSLNIREKQERLFFSCAPQCCGHGKSTYPYTYIHPATSAVHAFCFTTIACFESLRR